jgi:hypothetical protein
LKGGRTGPSSFFWQERKIERPRSMQIGYDRFMVQVCFFRAKIIKKIHKKCKISLADSKKMPTFAIPFGKSQYEEGKTR